MYYCNINRPPDVFNSSSDELEIIFYKYFDLIELSPISNLIGFRMFYTVIEEPEKKLTDYMDNYSKGKKLIIRSLKNLIVC